jgi:hypothetical protein
MQNTEECMFCRYRKARLANCCATHRAVSEHIDGTGPVQAAPMALPDKRDPTLPQPARQEAPHFA